MLANSEPEYVFAQLQSVRYPKREIEVLPLPSPKISTRWEDFYENVVDVIEGKATPIVTHAEIRRSMKVMMATFESAKNKTTVIL